MEELLRPGRQITDQELVLIREDLARVAAEFGLANGGSDSEFVADILHRVECLSGKVWSQIPYDQIRKICRHASVGIPVRMRGYVRGMSSVTPSVVNGTHVDTMELILADDHNDVITALPISHPGLISQVQNLHAEYQALEFCGTVIPALLRQGNSKMAVYKFFLADIEPADNPLQMIQATSSEIAAVAALVNDLSDEPDGILNYIKSQLVTIIGIKGLDEAPQLDQSLSFMIVAALGDGYDARRCLSHKLHSLVIGSPAVGKKLLCVAAEILNPAYTEAQPSRVSVPGVAGRAQQKNGLWTSHPGLIPMAHRGTFSIQDFHHVEPLRKRELLGVLSPVMENGRIINGTAASASHHALTSIHLDLNKTSDVTLDGMGGMVTSQARLADLGLTMNILSRFDFVIDIPRDAMRQMDIALRMHSGSQRSSSRINASELPPAARQLKVLVAYLRFAYDEISIPEALTETYIRSKQEELLRINHSHLTERVLLSDFQTRLANSIHKIVFAVTRGHARNIATEADVDDALRFVHTKLKFLQTIEPFDVPAWEVAGTSRGKVQKRQDLIRHEFGGRDVSVELVHEYISQQHDRQVTPRTIRRDLEAIAVPVHHGVFRVAAALNGKMAE